jgi:hypothetical protein
VLQIWQCLEPEFEKALTISVSDGAGEEVSQQASIIVRVRVRAPEAE